VMVSMVVIVSLHLYSRVVERGKEKGCSLLSVGSGELREMELPSG
jgi:hypothetical protein